MTIPDRAWMRLPSGKHLDLANPDPAAWDDADLAVRLARTYRWGGESSWPLPLSVAQHSLFVLELRRQTADAPLSREQAMLELLHDAEEGFLGFDCIGPLKAMLGDPFRKVADGLVAALARRYDLPDWTEAEYRAHKHVDLTAAASEAVHCVGWRVAEVREVLGISAPILDEDPLVARYGAPAWEPWPSELAAARFLAELRQLTVS